MTRPLLPALPTLLTLLFACSDEPSKPATDAGLPSLDGSPQADDASRPADDAGADAHPPSTMDASPLRDASPVDPANDAEAPPDDGSVVSELDAQTTDAAAGDAAGRDAEPDGTTLTPDGGAPDAAQATTESFVYVGGWDWDGDPYPYRTYKLDRATGALAELDVSDQVGANPSFAAASEDGRFLYIANEFDAADGLTVAALDATTGLLSVLERQVWDRPGAPVFASLDPSGKFVLAANYDGGEVIVHRIEADGKLSAIVDAESFGAGAETHSVRVHPSGSYAYAPNKAHDNIAQFRFDSATGDLTLHESEPLLATSEDGPRHIAFTPDGKFAYVSFELSNAIGAYRIEQDGTLSQLETESTLPSGFSGTSTGAHVLVHPSGKFVYASNRGHDSIAVFAIGDDGHLTLVEHEPSRGKTPRNFDIDQTGRLLVVANQGDDASNGVVAVFSIAADGRLSYLEEVTGLPSSNSIAIVTRTRF